LKKLLSVMVILFLVISLTACRGDKECRCEVEYNNSYIKTYEVYSFTMTNTKTKMVLMNGDVIHVNNHSVICYTYAEENN